MGRGVSQTGLEIVMRIVTKSSFFAQPNQVFGHLRFCELSALLAKKHKVLIWLALSEAGGGLGPDPVARNRVRLCEKIDLGFISFISSLSRGDGSCES